MILIWCPYGPKQQWEVSHGRAAFGPNVIILVYALVYSPKTLHALFFNWTFYFFYNYIPKKINPLFLYQLDVDSYIYEFHYLIIFYIKRIEWKEVDKNKKIKY